MAVVDASARKVAPHETENPTAGEAGIDAMMREFFHKKPSEGVPEAGMAAAVAVQSVGSRRDFDMATELLDRATQAFDLLINRCQTLEHDLNEANEQARASAVERDSTIDQWKKIASTLKEQLDASARDASALKARCEAAEARATAAEKRVNVLERASAQAAAHAATADQLSTKLHDKVVAAFGIGSRAHPVLEAVATRAAAE